MTIRIWPGGTWQSTEDIPYSWMSDDYEVHYVPDNVDPDTYIESIVHPNECTCPDCCESLYYQWIDGDLVTT